MTTHLEDSRLNDWADGLLDDAAAAEVNRHLAECAVCRAAADRLRSYLARIVALPRESSPAPWVRAAVLSAAGTPKPRWWNGPALKVAAVLALMVLSFAVGRRWEAPQSRLPESAGSADVASEVQRTGTAYVAALVSLSHAASRADSATVRQGREAALAALEAATLEVKPATPPIAPRVTLF